MEIQLLGALELRAAGQRVEVGPAKQRVLLAALAVDVGRPVPVHVLIDRIWDDAPPRGVRNVLHTYVTRIRRVLERAQQRSSAPAAIERRSDGYQLVVDPDVVDVHRFRRMVEQARRPGTGDRRRAALLGEAVGMWRTEALGGVPGGWATRVREGLRQQLLTALTQWAESELALGRHPVVIARLEHVVVEYPLAESLVARLMEALHAAGRDAEALDVYAKARARLADALGTEPSQPVRELHRSILRGAGGAGGAELAAFLPAQAPA